MNTRRHERIIDEIEAASWVTDGMTIAVGQPTPMALVRQIIRRGVENLTIIDAGFSLDMLVASGCVGKVISYYAGGGFGNPVMPAFRRSAERGEIEVWECEEGILCAGLQAAAQLLPFLPWRGGIGTSLPEVNSDLRVFKDPIKGETLLAVPPFKPE
jgi:glutaconate CoA-transferase, subunit A